jgi:hypothetical protein
MFFMECACNVYVARGFLRSIPSNVKVASWTQQDHSGMRIISASVESRIVEALLETSTIHDESEVKQEATAGWTIRRRAL